MTKEKIIYRAGQGLLLALHFAHLKWILYALSEGGVMPFNEVMLHFLGLALLGAGLIYCSAYWFKKHVHL